MGEARITLDPIRTFTQRTAGSFAPAEMQQILVGNMPRAGCLLLARHRGLGPGERTVDPILAIAAYSVSSLHYFVAAAFDSHIIEVQR